MAAAFAHVTPLRNAVVLMTAIGSVSSTTSGCPLNDRYVCSRRMARTSASRKSQRATIVYDFVPYFVRRMLGWRIGPRGVLLSRANPNGTITVVHKLRDACSGETVDRRIAQLRMDTDGYQLFWKKGNGRWTAYYDDRGDVFVGSLSECVAEISRDPFNCYW